MNLVKRTFLSILQNPLLIIEWLIILMVGLGILITISPLPENLPISSYNQLVDLGTVTHVLYVGLLIPVTIGIVGILNTSKSWSLRLRRINLMSISVIYTFVALVRLFSYGIGAPIWVAGIGLALISGTIYLTLGKIECRG